MRKFLKSDLFTIIVFGILFGFYFILTCYIHDKL